MPEDWAGAFKLANEKINWRNGIKVIIHLADAGAHGKEFTLSDKYPEESAKLKEELLKCYKKKIKIFGYIITEDARNSFNQSQNFYRSNGGSYEICEFKISGDSSSDDDDRCHKIKKKCRKKKKAKYKELSDESDNDSEEGEEKFSKFKKTKSKRKKEDSEDEIEEKMEKTKGKKCKDKRKESESDSEEEKPKKRYKKDKSKKKKRRS